nr:hypothetical protein [Tanacetum cinerariifolium]
MSRDVITVGSTMRISLLYRGEYSQWRERFMNYLEEQTNGEAMINSIQNGDQPLSVIAQVSLAGTTQNAPHTLKDRKFWTAEEKKTRKIDRLAISLLIQGLPNDIYSLIDSNETAKDLWDALERQMRGSEYGEQDRKAVILYEYETFKAIEGEQLLDTMETVCYTDEQTKNLIDINIDALYNILKQNQRDVNDALRYKKKAVVVHSDPLALVAEKMNVSKRKEKVIVSSDSEGSGSDYFSELKNVTALLAKAFNRRKFYSKPTNNKLRTSSTSQSANKKQEFVKTNDKKVKKKADEKKRDMSKVKCYNCKKEGHFAKDCKKVKIKDYEYYKTKMLLAKKDKDEQVLLAEDQAWMESSSDSDQEINANMVFMAQIEKVLSESDESSSPAEETIAEVSYYTSESESESEYETSKDYDTSTNYGLFVNNDDDHEIFHDAIESASENFIENHIDSKKDYDKSEVDHNDSEEKEHLVDKLIQKFNHKIAKCQKHEVVNLLEKEKANLETIESLKSKGFESSENVSSESENQSEMIVLLLEKSVTNRRIQRMCDLLDDNNFFIFDDESVKISPVSKMPFRKKPRDSMNVRSKRCSKHMTGNRALLTNFMEKFLRTVRFGNNDFAVIAGYGDVQTSSLKPYVPNVILEKIIIDLEDEVVNLLEKEKANLETIESLKSKGFESSENENSKVITPGMFKLNVSQCVSPISMSKSSCDYKNVEIKLKRKRYLYTFNSVRRPKNTSVIWKKKWSSNNSNVSLSAVSDSKLHKNVKRYSRKDLLACNNSSSRRNK